MDPKTTLTPPIVAAASQPPAASAPIAAPKIPVKHQRALAAMKIIEDLRGPNAEARYWLSLPKAVPDAVEKLEKLAARYQVEEKERAAAILKAAEDLRAAAEAEAKAAAEAPPEE